MRIKLILVAVLLPLSHAAASAESEVLATVNQFVDQSNKGNLEAAARLCAPNAAVIDDFPPHAWIGANACANWGSALAAFSKAHGIAGAMLATGQPRHVDVTGARAYVVLPVQYSYTKHGTKVVESGSVWTLVLQRDAGVWRISAWAWAE